MFQFKTRSEGEDNGADVAEVRHWCEENLWIHARPSLYDCKGKWYAYHTIRFDI